MQIPSIGFLSCSTPGIYSFISIALPPVDYCFLMWNNPTSMGYIYDMGLEHYWDKWGGVVQWGLF